MSWVETRGLVGKSRRFLSELPARLKEAVLPKHLIVLLTASAALLTLWSLAVPIFEAPDEGAHWLIARYLHEMHRLPFYDSRLVEANQPPLYYVLIAPFAADSEVPPPAVHIDAQGRVIPFYPPKLHANSKDDFAKYWPIRISRLVTALFSVLTVLFCYLSGVEATGNRMTGLLAGGLTALLPQFTFRGMNISNDALVATTCAAAVYLIVRLARRGFTWPLGWATAAVIGVAFLSKISAIFLPIPFALAVISAPAPWRTRLRRLSVLALSLLLVGPWLLRNQFLYGDPLASQQMFVAVPGLIDIKPITSPYFLTTFPSVLMRSFIGVFGAMNLYLPELLYKFFGLLAAVAVLGYLWRLIRRRFDVRLTLILTTVVLFTVLLTVQLNLTFTQPQGRYLFPALTAIALLVAIGLEGVPKWGRNWTYGTLAVVALVNLYSVIGLVLPAYWTLPAEPLFIDTAVSDGLMKMPAGPLRPGGRFGQTFLAHHNGLSRLEVEIATYGRKIPGGVLRMHLRAGVHEPDDIACWSIPLSQIADNSYAALKFPPIPDSKGRLYYVLLEAEQVPPTYALTVWLSAEDVYSEGQFFLNGEPRAQDTAFRIYYTQ